VVWAPGLTEAQLVEIVKTNDKRRLTISSDGQRIRAAHGYSIDVDVGLPAAILPNALYHGTASQNLDKIFESCLNPGRRRQVHLSQILRQRRVSAAGTASPSFSDWMRGGCMKMDALSSAPTMASA